MTNQYDGCVRKLDIPTKMASFIATIGQYSKIMENDDKPWNGMGYPSIQTTPDCIPCNLPSYNFKMYSMYIICSRYILAIIIQFI